MLGTVKQIMAKSPNLTAPEIVAAAKSDYGVDIPPRTAGVYRYQILHPKKTKKRKYKYRTAATPVTPARAAGGADGYDDLLRAAEKLGWKRVKDVVQKITQAPS
jgi:hypothetical protein